MADVGLNPPKAGNIHSRTGNMQDALAQFGSVVVTSANGNHADMQTTTSAGATGVMGVITSQGDPNNGGLFAVGDQPSVRDLGDAEILCVAGTYAVGTALITSTTAGACKAIAAEAGADIVATSLQAITLAAPGRISGRLIISRRGS